MASLKKRIEKIARREILKDLLEKRVRISTYGHAYVCEDAAWVIKDINVSIEEEIDSHHGESDVDIGWDNEYIVFKIYLTVINKAGHKRHVTYDLDLD